MFIFQSEGAKTRETFFCKSRLTQCGHFEFVVPEAQMSRIPLYACAKKREDKMREVKFGLLIYSFIKGKIWFGGKFEHIFYPT